MKKIEPKPYHAPMTPRRKAILREMALRCSGICRYTGVTWPIAFVEKAYAAWVKLGRPRWTEMVLSTVRTEAIRRGEKPPTEDGHAFVARPKDVTSLRRTTSERRSTHADEGGGRSGPAHPQVARVRKGRRGR